MRIAFLIYQFSPESGGVERAAANLANGLIERGHEVHIFARRIHAAANGIVPHPIQARSILPAGRHTAFAARVRDQLRHEHFDLIHSFTRTLKHDILRLGGGTHREYLNQMEHGRSSIGNLFARFNPKERAILRLEAGGFRRGNYRRIVAVSHRVKEEVIRHYGVPAGDITVIHNGVDTGRFHPSLRKTARPDIRRAMGLGNHFTLLYCGTGFRRKGLRYAIDTVARIPDARLLVVGGGDTSPYREQARKLAAGPRVLFLGPRTGVEKLYATADLLIHPTLYDPFPNVCLEAMACGTAVLTTRVAGVSEVIRDGKDSFVVEHGSDVEAMVERARSWDPDHGKAARRVAEEHTLEMNLAANLSLYDELVPSP